MAAAFDRDLVRRSFDAIADEMRAKNNAVRAARGES
jgi:beta-glucosidase-like glycosyl hydrolase